ncbi:hypothetical protein GGQ74_000791 [Desulfobaculum xiamenense]|uniref:Carboxypeptidase regulatory-like domain-containing protein n=1 Tax=Desulfobaculum xiamenense TaxID=995050 RepID=A0A846QFZ0_9BACT|nr:carboxypeptidase-like regulatory domain-containing protein [Desulfobaculum xiamenense]NJB67151.1 hypothetical protein [Desulfobaculum xiamenense]
MMRSPFPIGLRSERHGAAWRIFLAALLIVFAMMISDASAQNSGTSIRGLVTSRHPYTGQMFPSPGVMIELYRHDMMTGQWMHMGGTRTNGQGFYFFWNLQPGPYVLQVNGMQNFPVQVVPVDPRFYQFQDIPPLMF